MTKNMTTDDSKTVSNSNRNLTVKLKHLVKLRSFKSQSADRNIPRLEDSTSSDQLTAVERSTDNIGNKAINDGLNSWKHHQKLALTIVPGSVNDISETQLILNNHSKDYTVCKTRVSESSIFHTENKCSVFKDRFQDSELTHKNTPLRDFPGINQSSSSRQHIIVHNSEVENNFQAINSNIPEQPVKSLGLQFIKIDETCKGVLKNSSLMQAKQISSAVPTEAVNEACRAITENFASSVTVSDSKFTVQGCNEGNNSVEKYTGDNLRTESRKMHQKEYSGSVEDIDAVERINSGLQMLKTDLAAMRGTDLALLKQLISISQAIQLMQRTNLMRSSRSLSFVSSSRNLHLRYSTMERQVSAPHGASCRRDSFSFRRASTEDSLGDSLYSLDTTDSESQNQLEESNSLSIFYTSSSTSPSKLYHDLILSYVPSENTEEYEDILRRNVRLWKIGSQEQDLLEELVVV